MRPCMHIMGALLLMAHPANANPAEADKLRLVGCLPHYRVDALETSGAIFLDDLLYFAVIPCPRGTLDMSNVRAAHLKKLDHIRRKHKVKIHLAIGSWGRGKHFPETAASAQNRENFAQALLGYCVKHHFSGVDLDWEFPANPQEERNFVLLIRDTARILHAKGLSISVSVNPRRLPLPEAIPHLDRLYLMSYDHDGRHLRPALHRKSSILGCPFTDGRSIIELKPQPMRKSLIVIDPRPKPTKLEAIFSTAPDSFTARQALHRNEACPESPSGKSGRTQLEMPPC